LTGDCRRGGGGAGWRNQFHFIWRAQRSHAAPRTRSNLHRLRHRFLESWKHNWRFGGDYRRILQSFHSARNAEGSFVFTGFATSQYAPGSTQPVPDTGYDFADFLLGYPQQTSLQFGTTSYSFRANSFDFFAQDDWRILSKLSLNLGLRYEYNGPYTEAQDRIANLQVGPGFAAAVPVVPAGAVLPPGSGHSPSPPIHPFCNPTATILPSHRHCLETSPENRGPRRLRHQLQPRPIQHHDSELRVSTSLCQRGHECHDLAGLIGPAPLTLVNGFPALTQGHRIQ